MVSFGTFYFGTFDLEKFRISFLEIFLSCSRIRFLSLHFDYLLSQSRTSHMIFKKKCCEKTLNRTKNRQKFKPGRTNKIFGVDQDHRKSLERFMFNRTEENQ